MKCYRNIILGVSCALAMLTGLAASANAGVVVTGSVGPSGKVQMLTVNSIGATTPAVFKFAFQNQTPGTVLTLCAGSSLECTIVLGQSSVGQTSFGAADINQLSGMFIWVERSAGTAVSKFAIQIE